MVARARNGRRRLARSVALATVVVALAAGCYQPFDFTGDHHADHVAVNATGAWRNLERPADDPVFVATEQYGFVAGDWDGNGSYDPASITSTGDWVTKATGTFSFPKPAQLPAYASGGFHYVMDAVPADYDGDGKTEAAWYRDTDGTWFIRGRDPVVFGHGPSFPCFAPPSFPSPGCGTHGNDVVDQDLAVPADYDGDKKADLATFNPRTMVWRVKQSSDGAITTVTVAGSPADLPLPAPADYDGVGHAQRAVYGVKGWWIEGHAALDTFGLASTGTASSYPAVADYDGDGHADLSAVGRDGTWRTRSSKDPTTPQPTYAMGAPSPTLVPVAAGTALLENIARLTLVARNCTPGQYNYPNDC